MRCEMAKGIYSNVFNASHGQQPSIYIDMVGKKALRQAGSCIQLGSRLGRGRRERYPTRSATVQPRIFFAILSFYIEQNA